VLELVAKARKPVKAYDLLESLRDIDKLISEETGLYVQVADDPLTCVARGGGRALELIDMHGSDFFASE
jgi:rod shape-determining protein MreB